MLQLFKARESGWHVDSLGSSPEQLSVWFNASKSMVPPERGLWKPYVDIP